MHAQSEKAGHVLFLGGKENLLEGKDSVEVANYQ